MKCNQKWRCLAVLLMTMIMGGCLGYLLVKSGQQNSVPSMILNLPRGEIVIGAQTFSKPIQSNAVTIAMAKDVVITDKDIVVSTQTSPTDTSINHTKTVLRITDDMIIYDTKIVKHSTSPLLTNKCVPLKIPDSHSTTPICVYDISSDIWISRSLSSSGTWEEHIMIKIKHALDQDPNTTFLDLGCNIGVFTLMAARLGHIVVSVDPLWTNLFLLSRSLEQGQLTANVTLLNNAIGDKVEQITLHDYADNIGGTFVKPVPPSGVVDEDHAAMAVTLDHLTPLLANQTVVMKMDIESYEWNALKGGYYFFNNVNVTCIFMEWAFHKNSSSSAAGIIGFMKKFSFLPHWKNAQLQLDENTTWPDDIMWIKSLNH